MPQTEGGLPFVDARAEQLELEGGLDLAEVGGKVGADPEPALPHAGERVVVFAELVLEPRQPRDPQRVEPVRVDLLEVVADVEHGEAVDLHARFRVGRRDAHRHLGWILRGGRRGTPKVMHRSSQPDCGELCNVESHGHLSFIHS